MTDWYSDHSEVLEFGYVLQDQDKLKTAEDVLYYFEKPWKWSNEYWEWKESGGVIKN